MSPRFRGYSEEQEWVVYKYDVKAEVDEIFDDLFYKADRALTDKELVRLCYEPVTL